MPERPRAQTDREWVAAYARRSAAARLRPYNRILAADVESQNAELSRAWAGAAHHAERRAVSRARVAAMLADAALENDLKRWRAERGEVLGLIERLSGRDTGYAIRGSRAERERLREIIRSAPRPVRRQEIRRGGLGGTRRLEDLGYGEWAPGGCPPCSDCHYVICRCGR